ncbi:MAG TPA: carboxylating nicotinate-nucleotide diphosphorylase [Fibrobacteraceae bacterium]|nr:carboxylating nicotinate-nucleotide diphosphorylase [Fibrobacteraceae bacterium]
MSLADKGTILPPFSPSQFPVSDALALIRLALAEDVGTGDVTSLWTIPETQTQTATLIAKQDGVLAGLPVIALVYQELKVPMDIQFLKQDGEIVSKGDHIATLTGTTRALLTGERILLNFLQQLSGVASIAATYMEALRPGKTMVLDTRKTLPGFRRLQKYAVRAGGGANHRMGLHDMVLVKDNHIAAAGGVLPALDAVRRQNDRGVRVEIEVESLDQLRSLLHKGVDIIMLDNMDDATLTEAVRLVRESGDPAQLEASGNMDLERVRRLAPIGLDFISVGALTHSVRAMDISMRIL